MKKIIINILFMFFLISAISSCGSNIDGNDKIYEEYYEINTEYDGGWIGYYVATNEVYDDFNYSSPHKFIAAPNYPAHDVATGMFDISETGNLFEGLQSGYKIEITFETWYQANPSGSFYDIDKCRIVEIGSLEDIPQYVQDIILGLSVQIWQENTK